MEYTSSVSPRSERHRKNERCSSHQERKTPMRPAIVARNGFLSHAFEPLSNTIYSELKHNRKVETEFFYSLKCLADFYKFEPLQPVGLPFPYNLHIAFRHAEQCMAAIDKSLELEVIQDKTHHSCITTKKTFGTGYTLYYIPVRPLHQLRIDKTKNATANLLTALFGQLYRRGVASNAEECSFLNGNYEMIKEMLMENDGELEADEYQCKLSDCYVQEWYGGKILKSLRHPYHAMRFAEYLKLYQPQSDWEKEIKNVCEQFLKLFTLYPNGHFHRQMDAELISVDEDSIIIEPDNYLSFFWCDTDSIYEELQSMVNSTLQECGNTVEPTALQFFDKGQDSETHDFYFEWRFLLLTDYLSDLLFTMP
jgi:hypothetical protein